MANSLAPAEPYTLSFETTVEEAFSLDDGHGIILSETYFYPEGGGQPADRGIIADIPVRDVQQREDRVVHTLAEPLSEGQRVTGEVDPDFRTYCMRAHTASHALYGAGRRVLEDIGYGGFDIGENKVRVDFTTSTDITDSTLVELERLVNRVVWEARSVSWEERSRAEALADETVAFNTKTEEGVEGESVRIVTIDEWDQAACGGTHVRNTQGIGPVSVLDRSNPGEGLTRVEFAVGPAGIERRATEKRATLEAAGMLGTNVADLPESVARVRDQREELEEERDALRAELVDARLADLPVVEYNGGRWLVGSVRLGLDANSLAEAASDHVGDGVEVVALVTEDGTQVAVATDGSVNAGDVVDQATTEFGGGGGGSPTSAQGGGMDADVEEVVALLRGERQ